MAIRILWDKEEAAILLEALVKTLDGKISRDDAISSVSWELRERAKKNGIKIDEIFRNKNGITLQMSTMEYIYTEGKSGLDKGKMPTFRKVVNLYKNDRSAYEKLLKGARQKMQKSNSVQDEFFAWLATKVSVTKLSDFYMLYVDIESFCCSRKIIHQKLFETVDLSQVRAVLNTVNANKVFRSIYKKSAQKMYVAIKYYYDFVKMHPELNDVNKQPVIEMKQAQDNLEALEHTTADNRHPEQKYIDKEKLESASEEFVIDFYASNSLAYTKPIMISYFGDEYPVNATWKEAYVKVASCLQEDYPEVFEKLLGKNIYGRGRIDVGCKRDLSVMISPKKVRKSIYLETNYGATDIVKKIRVLLDMCNVDYENLKIRYRNKRSENELVQEEKKGDIQRKSHNNKVEEIKTLQTTEQQAINTSNSGRLQFIEWLQNGNISTAHILGYTSAIKKCTKFANEKKLISTDFFELNDITMLYDLERKLFADIEVYSYEISHGNMLHKGFEKLIEFKKNSFLRTRDNVTDTKGTSNENEIPALATSVAHYTEILNKYFGEDGYQLGRAIFRGRFKRFYSTEFGEELPDSYEKMEIVLQQIGTVRDGRVFPKQDAEQNSLIEEIIKDIIDTLDAGASAVYIEAVYDKYQKLLADHLQIYHMDALTTLLIDNAKGRYNQRYSYLVKGWKNADTERDLLRVMKTSHQPLNYESIHRKLWYVPYDKMKQRLSVNKSIVNVAPETYFYAPNLPINTAELKKLIALIQTELEYRLYITDVELMEMIQTKLPSVAVNTDGFTTYGLRNCLGYILRDQFSFNGQIISEVGKELSMSDVYKEYAHQHEHLTLEDIKNFSKEMDTIIYWNSIMDEQIRVSKTEFVRRDLIKFDMEAIDVVLDGMCFGDYMPIKDVSLFLYFPSVGYQWNSYLLESYLYSVSRKFKLLHTSFTQTGVYGAMVRVESNIREYSDLIIEVLSRSSALENANSALQYIVASGYQKSLRLKDIDQMIGKAKLIKEIRKIEEK